MIAYHRIAARLYGQPLLLLPTTAQTIESFVRCRIRDGSDVEAGRGGGAGSTETGAQSVEAFQQTASPGGGVEIHGARSSRFVGSTPLDAQGRPQPFRRTADGTAIITIVGELVNRGAWIGASSGLVSYEGINHQLSAAAADPDTRTILLDIESPGGEAVGAFECAAMVRKAAAVKPVIAVVNGMACSAGYAIASGATRIITSPTGLCGSIGVVMVHLDYSKMLADVGIEPTFIFAGDHKVDGNPYEPLPKDVREQFQSEIDAFYGLFVQTVAAGRGARMGEDAVRGTQARVLMGEAAVAAGLADEVMTFDDAVAYAGRFRSASPFVSASPTVARSAAPKREGGLLASVRRSVAETGGTMAPLREGASAIERAAHAAATAQLAERSGADSAPEQVGGLVAAARRAAAETLRAAHADQ